MKNKKYYILAVQFDGATVEAVEKGTYADCLNAMWKEDKYPCQIERYESKEDCENGGDFVIIKTKGW